MKLDTIREDAFTRFFQAVILKKMTFFFATVFPIENFHERKGYIGDDIRIFCDES